jgi:MYXO-CTERM domain-containing protein
MRFRSLKPSTPRVPSVPVDPHLILPGRRSARRGLSRWIGVAFAALTGLATVGVADSAHAQFAVSARDVLDLEVEDGNEDASNARFTINIRDCAELVAANPTVTLQWTFNQAPLNNAKFAIKLQGEDATCTFSTVTLDADQTGCVLLESSDDLNGTRVGREISFQNLIGLTDPTECYEESDLIENIAGIIYTNPADTTAGDDANDYVNSQINVNLRRARPSAPTLDTVEAGESSLRVVWTDANEYENYRVYYSTTPFLEGEFPEDLSGVSSESSVSTSTTISDGISVGSSYYVAVVAEDDFGNRSVLSNVLEASTEPTQDFFEQYLAAGGVEQGGYCASAPAPDAGFLALMLAGLGWTVRLRRRR